MKRSSFFEQFPEFKYLLGVSTKVPDPTPVFEKPQQFTNDPSKIQKINLLKKQYDQELWHARYAAGTKSGLLGSIPSLALAFGAGSMKSYLTERLDSLLKMTRPMRQTSKFGRRVPESWLKFYKTHPSGVKLALGLGLPLIGATLGAGIGIGIKPFLYNIEYGAELDKLKKKYFKKLKTIL